jgi:aromatic ring-cleaving dioxygenase
MNSSSQRPVLQKNNRKPTSYLPKITTYKFTIYFRIKKAIFAVELRVGIGNRRSQTLTKR